MNQLKYRENSYFNEEDEYMFESTTHTFRSKVTKSNGNYYTQESLKFKAASIPCFKMVTLSDLPKHEDFYNVGALSDVDGSSWVNEETAKYILDEINNI